MGVQGKKLTACAVTLAAYVFLLLLFYFVHARFFRVEVVFYSALFDAGLACCVASLLWLLRPFSVLDLTDRILLFFILILGGYGFAISIPTVIDRSLSFYLLEKIEQRGGKIRESAIDEIIATEYLREFRVAEARLTEQLESGTIEIINDCVVLTEKGLFFAKFSKNFRRNFLPQRRLLSGQYTDALTDPLGSNQELVDYGCSAIAQ